MGGGCYVGSNVSSGGLKDGGMGIRCMYAGIGDGGGLE